MRNRPARLVLPLLALSLVFLNVAVFASPPPPPKPAAGSAKDEWLQVRTKNFNLIGNASEKDVRKVATRLEQFRESFRLIFPRANLTSPTPTNVIVFKSSGAYKPFKPVRADGKTDNFIAGYFQPGEDVNYITLSTEGEDSETYGTIFHEYVHFLVNTNFGKSDVPPWFNEGLAEYYQTFQIEKDQEVKLGLPQSNHLALLQTNQLIPLETMFKITNYALHQNGSHSRSIFYAQAWALMHYLVQSGKTESLGKFLTLSMQNVPPEKAFQDAFQLSYAQMEKDLRKYVEQRTYKYTVVSFKNKLLFDAEMQTSPLPEASANAYLGDLLYHTNRPDDAESYLRKALGGEPNSSLANTTMGMVKLRQRKYEEAKTFLEKAMSDDQKNHLAIYQFAYLLSREDRDEFGYVQSFSPEKSQKMRGLLKKAIAVNPSFTQSYELLAFVNLVNNEQLDEAVALLQQALKYQPGNQRYAMRIAEVRLRQGKFDEARQALEKIARTADEPEVKRQAERLAAEVRQAQEIMKGQEDARSRYEASSASNAGGTGSGGGRPALSRREAPTTAGREPTPEEIARIEEEAQMYSINKALKKPGAGEKQAVGRIAKVECKGGTITYTIKAGDPAAAPAAAAAETFTLTSKDFQSLTLTTFVDESDNLQLGCGAKAEDLNAVLTYKIPAAAKGASRGELVAIDFVPKNFRFVDTSKPPPFVQEPAASAEGAGTGGGGGIDLGGTPTSGRSTQQAPPPPLSSQDAEKNRREMMLEGLRRALRQPLEGEKREVAFIEKIECSEKGMFFHIRTKTQTLVMSAATPQSVQLRAFTPDVEQVRFGCGLKQVDVPAVVTYKPDTSLTAKAEFELIAIEFVPKSFVLEK